MSTDHEFFLMQLGDSFFPSGMFGLSNGLESLVKNGKIRDEKDILNFILLQIEFQLVPCDCIVVANAMDAIKRNSLDELVQTDNMFYSMRLIKEARNASTRSGSQILNCVIQMLDEKGCSQIAKDFMDKIKSKKSVGTYPVCLGVSAFLLGIPNQSVTKMMLYSFSQSIIAAAIRLGIIDHIRGQKLLIVLSDKINLISSNVKKMPLDNLWQLTPLTDIFQMKHEHDSTKMFIT